MKINVDVAFPTDQAVIGVAALAQDHNGNKKGSVSSLDDGKLVLEAKIQTIWWGLCLAKELNCVKVFVKSDFLLVVNIMNCGKELWP